MAIKRTSSNSLVNATKMSTGFSSAAIPNTPTIGAATATSDVSATVAYTAAVLGANGTTFTATSSPSSITGSSATSPITVSGLTGSTNYTFTVKSSNANGDSVASSASNQITTNATLAGAIYFAGGGQTSGQASGIDKINTSDDTKTTLSATLSSGRSNLAGFANSGTAAYFAGGYDAVVGGPISGIDKIAFAADTKSTLSATLSTSRYSPAGFANSGTAGYVLGGYGTTFLSSIEKITFSSDTKTVLSATLNNTRAYIQGCANSGTAGYIASGYGDQAGYQSNTNKLAFSNETISVPAAGMVIDGTDNSGAANSGVAGYWAGGASGSGSTLRNIIVKLNFSDDTSSTLSAVLASAKYALGGAAKSGTAAYWGGGNGPIDLIQKLTFSGETRTTLTATLTTSRGNIGAAANSGIL